MTRKKTGKQGGRTRTPHSQLAREAAEWDATVASSQPRILDEANEAVPHAGRSKTVSLRLPAQLLQLLQIFANREGVGYQVLIKRWLDDRLRDERDKLRGQGRR